MPTDHHLDPEENALAKMGYETEDVEFKKLGRSIVFFFGFVVFCGVAGVLIFFLFLSGGSPYGAWEKFTGGPTETAPFVDRLPQAPNPLLQTNLTARTDILDLRRQENALLHGRPSWVNKQKGIVRIPIDQAIDEYVRTQGVPSSQPSTMASGAPPVLSEPPHEGETR